VSQKSGTSESGTFRTCHRRLATALAYRPALGAAMIASSLRMMVISPASTSSCARMRTELVRLRIASAKMLAAGHAAELPNP
jgi:hypothetical protein